MENNNVRRYHFKRVASSNSEEQNDYNKEWRKNVESDMKTY